MPNDIPEPQAVTTPINRSAIFIVATLAQGEEHAATARAWCADATRSRKYAMSLRYIARPSYDRE